MARIQRYQAQGGLRPAAGPVGRLQSYDAKALQGLGSSITQLGAALHEQSERRANMEDTDNFQQMEARLRTEMFEAEQNMEPGAPGFTDDYLTRVFDPISSEYLSSIQDPERRAARERDLATLRERMTLQAARTEAGEVNRYQSDLITNNADGAFTRIGENPDAFDMEMEILEGLIDSSGLPPVRRQELRAAIRQGGAAVYMETLAELDPLRLLRETGGDIGQLDNAAAASILTNILRENSTVRGRPGERVGDFGMLRSDLARIAVADGVDVTAAGGLDAIVSNPTAARFYAQKHLEDLMSRFDDPRDAVVAFYMGEEYARGGYDAGSLPRAVRSTVNSIFEVMPVGSPGTTYAAGSGVRHPQGFGTFTTYSEMDRAAIAIASMESSGGDYSMVNRSSGATGAFQVMPDNIGPWTERWVGRRMTQQEFLADPGAQDAVFRGQFGSYMREFGSFEAAATAWFAGPGAVGAPGAGTRSDRNAGGGVGHTVNEYIAETAAVFRQGASQGPSGPAIPLTSGDGQPLDPSAYDEIDPQLVSTAQNVFAQFGYTELPILDAERAENAGYGASNSQHILHHEDGTPTGRSGALDISVAQLSTEERVQLIQALSAAGVTGIGVYQGNFIHIDLGPRRSWGNRDSGGGWGNVPSWARTVLQQHNANAFNGAHIPAGTRAPRNGALAGARGSDVRGAQDAAIEALTGGNHSTDVIREEAQMFLDDTLASYENGGEMPHSDLIEESLAVLTPDQQRSYREDLAAVQQVRVMTENIAEMTAGDMESMRNQLNAPNSGYGNTAYGQRVRADVEAAIEAEFNLRERNPAAATMRLPEVQNAWMNVVVDPETGLASGEAVVEYIRVSREAQMRRFGLPESMVKTLPNQHLAIVADMVNDVTRNPSLSREDRRAQEVVLAHRLQELFGAEASAVLADAVDYMTNGPADETSPEASLTAALRRAERDQATGDAPEPDPTDPPSTVDIAVDPSAPPADQARQAAARIQSLPTPRDRMEAISQLPADMQDAVRELLGV